jgi:hypothetical protein
VALAVLLTGLEIVATLVMLRMVWRLAMGVVRRVTGRGATATA